MPSAATTCWSKRSKRKGSEGFCDGSSKREKAQLLVVKGPAILDGIASDASASPRHRIDAIRTLDTFAANGPGAAAPAGDRFLIQINLGSDTLTFNKSIKPDPNDHDPNHPEDTPLVPFPVVDMPKRDDQW